MRMNKLTNELNDQLENSNIQTKTVCQWVFIF